MRFTDEQAEFARQIRDFCSKEVGTVEQRDALTAGGTETTSPPIYGGTNEIQREIISKQLGL
jgi:hypothetical protein